MMRTTEGSKSTKGDNEPRVVLALQGGGALGAYHIGAYQALHELGYEPDWVTGISIGAINSGVLAGNAPEDRLSKLEKLWDEISRPDLSARWVPDSLMRLHNVASAMSAVAFGQPNFFLPRFPGPWMTPNAGPGAASYYDTSPLRDTLLRLIDFDLINSRRTRISLGATQVRSGELVFFDNERQSLGPEHIMASGSLPPGFPAVEVGGDWYWDGGCVSNTPLDAVLEDRPGARTLVFMIDLWNAEGPAPANLDEVSWRQKQIQYASRTAHHIREVCAHWNLRQHLNTLATRIPKEKVNDPAVSAATDLCYRGTLDIVHIIYHPTEDETSWSDTEFSRASIARRREAGYRDMREAIRQSPWFAQSRVAAGAAMIHHVSAGNITQEAPMAQAAIAERPQARRAASGNAMVETEDQA